MSDSISVNGETRSGLSLGAVWQYVLIYLSLLMPGSTFVYIKGGTWFSFMLVALFAATFLLARKYRESYGVCFSLVLVLNTLLARSLTGGVGLEALMGFMGCVLIVQMAICCDFGQFLKRWLLTVVALALLSILLWGVGCVFPSVLKSLLGPTFVVDVIGTYPWETYEYGSGLFFYSWFDIHQFRNCGIYTEPGKYQVVLNSALFILLFWREKLELRSERHYRFYLSAIVVALVTCQSTTGYIGALLCVAFYVLFSKDHEGTRTRQWLVALVCAAVVALLVQYWLAPTNSILSVQVFDKLFGSSAGGTGLDLSDSTGVYRSKMIEVCVRSIAEHPLGVGYDALFSAASSSGEGLVAAALVSYGAVYGVVPWIVVLFMVFYPVFKGQRLPVALLYVALFVNTTLAQTHFLYTSLLIIPAYLAIGHGWPLRNEKEKYLPWKKFW